MSIDENPFKSMGCLPNLQFIQTLTGDKNIHIGHGQDSQTDQVQLSTYHDFRNNRYVTLVDTPGFDDSRDGVTDTDILNRIVNFLQQK